MVPVKKVIPLLSLGLLASLSANASNDTPDRSSVFIEGSYIVKFKAATRERQALIAAPAARQAAVDPSARLKLDAEGDVQGKRALGAALGLRGEVKSILETTRSAHIKMDAAEAERLRHHPDVERVEQNQRTTVSDTIQVNPGWGLDRLDQTTTSLNSQYRFNANGQGQTVYVLDSGLDLANPNVKAQFGDRASVLYDVNGGNGADCNGHGTQVASAIAGNTHGVAKGAKLVVAKITQGCTGNSDTATWAFAFDWLAKSAANGTIPRGTIVNLSSALVLRNINGQVICSNDYYASQGYAISPAAEEAIAAAYNAGVIVVVAAGNDGCDTAYYTPTRMPQAFVVGASDYSRLNLGQDAKATFSRIGTNISTFAPGRDVRLLNYNGQPTTNSGTSFSAPYIAGIFAAACQYYAPYCTTNGTGTLYQALRDFGTQGTVVNPDGSALTGATSRFISRAPW